MPYHGREIGYRDGCRCELCNQWAENHAKELAAELEAKKRRRTFAPKRCAKCGEVFTPNTNNQKYCSPECATAAKRLKMKMQYRRAQLQERRCEYCGEIFQPKNKNQRFCSKKCEQSAYNTARRHK